MKDPIELIKIGWKSGLTVLTVTTMLVSGLVLNLNSAYAADANLTLQYDVVNNSPGNSWGQSVTLDQGDDVKFYVEIHNTNVPTVAENVLIKATLPGGTFTDATSTATVSSDNSNTVNKDVSIHINGGGQLEYIPGSTKMTWNVDGLGALEYDNTVLSDGITTNGLVLGNQNGCNEYIIQLTFKAIVVSEPTPTPTPTPEPTPDPSPAPPAGNQDQDQNQEQNQEVNVDVDVNQENNQTVNITNAAPPVVGGGKKIPLKQPETGVSVLGLAAMGGAAPVGVLLSRFGRGKIASKGKEESLSEYASGMFENRIGKSNDA